MPKMFARSGLAGKKPPGFIWGHFRHIFHGLKTILKLRFVLPIFLVGPMGPIHTVWGHVLVPYLYQDSCTKILVRHLDNKILVP